MKKEISKYVNLPLVLVDLIFIFLIEYAFLKELKWKISKRRVRYSLEYNPMGDLNYPYSLDVENFFSFKKLALIHGINMYGNRFVRICREPLYGGSEWPCLNREECEKCKEWHFEDEDCKLIS